jgi:hypothetical protein
VLSGARLPAAVAFGAGGLSALLVACTSPDDNKEEVVPVDMPQREIDYRARFAATPIDLTGSVKLGRAPTRTERSRYAKYGAGRRSCGSRSTDTGPRSSPFICIAH